MSLTLLSILPRITLLLTAECTNLEHGFIVIEIGDALEEAPPDANIIQNHTHSSSRQWVPHVVGISQKKHSCQGQIMGRQSATAIHTLLTSQQQCVKSKTISL